MNTFTSDTTESASEAVLKGRSRFFHHSRGTRSPRTQQRWKLMATWGLKEATLSLPDYTIHDFAR